MLSDMHQWRLISTSRSFRFPTPLPLIGKYPLDKVIPLGMRVVERAADENADVLP